MAPRPRHTAIALATAFAIAVLSFVGSTVYSQVVAARIDATARSIADAAATSVRQLTTARVEIRHLEALVSQYASRPSPELRDAVQVAQRNVDQALAGYFAIEPFPDEEDIWTRLQTAATAFDHTVARAMAMADAGDGAQAHALIRGELGRRASEALDTVNTLVDFNARAGQALAREITEQRRTSTIVAAALDSLSVVLTAGLAWLAIVRIRSDQQALAAERAEAEARASELEKFAGRVAHDIRGPLAAAGLALATVERKVSLEEPTQRIVARGTSAVRRASAIVTGLLAFARAGARPAAGARTDLPALIREIVGALAPAAEAQQIELRLEAEPTRQVAGDAGMLISVVENLLRNAIKYIDGPERQVTVRVAERGPRVRVEVEDTGPGIPPELARTIFEPHVRGHADQGGIGIGLATVRRIVEAHGGGVGVRSAAGRGSLFWFELPAAP